MNNDSNKSLTSNPALGTRDTIEFEVNQECEFDDILENVSFFHGIAFVVIFSWSHVPNLCLIANIVLSHTPYILDKNMQAHL